MDQQVGSGPSAGVVNGQLLGQARVFGGVGSLLVFLTILPYVGGVLGILGLAFVLLAVKYIADAVRDRAIFRNMALGVGLAAAGIVVGVLVVFAAVVRFMGVGWMMGQNPTPPTLTPAETWAFIVTLIVGLLALWGFFLASAVYMKRSYDAIGRRLNVSMFHTAAVVYLVGAALAIILVGFLLLFLAEILFTAAFFSIPEGAPRSANVPPADPARWGG